MLKPIRLWTPARAVGLAPAGFSAEVHALRSVRTPLRAGTLSAAARQYASAANSNVRRAECHKHLVCGLHRAERPSHRYHSSQPVGARSTHRRRGAVNFDLLFLRALQPGSGPVAQTAYASLMNR